MATEIAVGDNCELKVLAVVEEPETAEQCLMAAAQAAAVDPKAVLTALHIEVDPAHIRAAPEEIGIQRLREEQEGLAHDRAIRVRRIFESWAMANPSHHARWRSVVSTIDAALCDQALQADLIVLLQPHNLDGADALHASIFHTGKPVLFVPRASSRSIELNHLSIAWKNTPQANKAVQEVRPWLAAAKRVSVLTVEEPQRPNDTARIEHLMRHLDVPFDLHHLTRGRHVHVGAYLLEEARHIRADALVMGAYRFGEALEWIFGGVTSEVLRQSSLPVFLAH